MKKILSTVILLLALSLYHIQAQEKGLYLTIGGSGGANTFCYTLDNDNQSIPLFGFGGNLGVQYFFTKHLGLATGIGLSYYNSKAHYTNNYKDDPSHYAFDNMTDGDPIGEFNNYQLRLSLNNWTEIQKAYFLEIPLMFMYQTKWGQNHSWGMYAGLGAKIQIPAFGKEYEVEKGSELTVTAYNYEYNIEYPVPGGADLSEYGFGTNNKITYNGDLDIKTGFAATAKLGILKTLSRRVDLTLGAYFDYGLTDIKNGNKTEQGYLLNPENGANTIHPASYVGDNLQYNGYINSYTTDKVFLLAIGGELGLRIKLGKLAEEPKKDSVIQEVKPEKLIYNVWVRDSLTKQPLLTQVAMVCQNCPQPDNKNFYSSDLNYTATELYPQNTYVVSTTKSGFPVYNTAITTTPEEREINILMPLHPNLTGIVLNTSNNPMQDAQVVVVGGNGKKYEILTDPEGRFTIPSVDAGMRYTAIASKVGYSSDTVHLNVPSDPKLLQPVYNVENEIGTSLRLKPIRKMVLSALVLFDLDKYDLRFEAKAEIDQIIPMLKENPQIMIEVGGHTDSRGSAKYNQTLSQNRANSVREYMISQGIDARRIKAKGYGYSQLVNQCKPKVKCSEAEHQENRRVEFIFTELPQHITPKEKKTASVSPVSTFTTVGKETDQIKTAVLQADTSNVLYIIEQPSTPAKAEITMSKQPVTSVTAIAQTQQMSTKVETPQQYITQVSNLETSQYRVQIAASRQPTNNNLYKKVENGTGHKVTEVKEVDGFYHYYVGEFYTKEQAQALQNQLKNLGIESFIKKIQL